MSVDKFEDQRRKYKFAPLYATLYIMAREIAQRCGYALAIHGTLARDCDLLAVPWTSEAVSPAELVSALCEGMQVHDGITGPQLMPHGRQAWAIAVGAGAYIDLSIMPTIGRTRVRTRKRGEVA